MPSRVVQFGVFQAHLDSRELYRDGIKLKLGGQPFQVLEYLLARPGEVVTRDELRTALWQADTFVDFDHGLNTAINKIREALGDSASNPTFVETVPRRGYRFIAPVDRPVPADRIEPPTPPPPVPSPPIVPLRQWPWVAAGVIGAGLIAFGLLAFRTPTTFPTDYKLTQVTRDSGLTWQPSLSRDGNFVVYASDRATGQDLDIWIQHVSGGQPVRLTSAPGHESYPSLSGDGRRVVFQSGLSVEERGVFLVPSLGGSPKLVSLAGRYPRLSPDGTMVAFSTGGIAQTSEIRVISTEGGEARAVAMAEWAVAPFWTQDGKGLFAWARRRAVPPDFWSTAVPNSAARNTGVADKLRKSGATPLMQSPFAQDPAPTACAAEGGMVIAARSGDGNDLWFCPSDGRSSAKPVRITVGAGASHPSVAGNGRIAFSRLAVNSGLWMLPLDAQSGTVRGERRRVWNENVTVGYPSVSARGNKLVYVSDRGGDPDVWLRDLETGADRQLTTTKAHEFRAVISRDGQSVAFGSGGLAYTMSANGGVPQAIPNFKAVNVAGWSPEGSKLVYYHGTPIRHATVEIATGRRQDLAWHPSLHIHNGRISPDGRWITFTAVGEATRVVYVASLENGGGGQPESWIRISGEGQATSSFWSPDGNLLYIHQGDVLLARKLRPETKQPMGDAFVVQRFNGPRVSAIFSADGLTRDALYFMLEETTSNIWLADPVVR